MNKASRASSERLMYVQFTSCVYGTFHQNHVSGRFERRLDYFLISNILQEPVIRADVLASFWSYHSPIIFTIAFELNNTRRKGMWKLNKSLLPNDEYTHKLNKKSVTT